MAHTQFYVINARFPSRKLIPVFCAKRGAFTWYCLKGGTDVYVTEQVLKDGISIENITDTKEYPVTSPIESLEALELEIR